MSVKSVDSDLLKTAVLTVVLYSDSRLKCKSLSYCGTVCLVVYIHTDYIYECR